MPIVLKIYSYRGYIDYSIDSDTKTKTSINDSVVLVGRKVGFDTDDICRGIFEVDISSLALYNTINSITVQFSTVFGSGDSPHNFIITSLGEQPSTASAADIYSYLDSPTTYGTISDPAWYQSKPVSVVLNSNAISDLQAAIDMGQSWFELAMKSNDEINNYKIANLDEFATLHDGSSCIIITYTARAQSAPPTPSSITPEIVTVLSKRLPSPHIVTPEENEQFNVGIVQVSWEQPATVAYIDLSDETQFQYIWNGGAGDVGQAEWLDIRNNLEDAAYGNAYGGRDFVYEMFLNPNSKVRSGDTDGKATYPNGEVIVDLGDDFDVIDIHPIYDSPAPSYPGSLEPFTFRVVNNTDGKQYKAYSDDSTYDINIILERQSEPLDESYLVYELEYTDDYSTENTTWSAINKRISWDTTDYSWSVGKMIKSRKARIRMRTKYLLSEYISDWTLSSLFTINVYKLSAPAIVSPLSNTLYTEFVQIILDESQLVNTYNQKVRYTVDYSSQKQSIDWTIIAKDIPVGQNIIRWSLDGVPSSDDYSLRITAQNVSTSCTEISAVPDQIARAFVHNVQIQQSGLFIIDTIPPQAVLEINKNTNITNQLNQVLNIFAEDASTSVKQIQLRECDVGNALLLGEINTSTETPAAGEDTCPSPISLIETRDFNTLITDSPIGNLSKIQWTFDALDAEGNPISAIKKIEALLTDMGGNTSLQEKTKVFLSVFNNSNNAINDFIVVIEQRDKTTFDGTAADHVSAVYEVAYAGTSTGQLWVLEPYSRFIYTIDDHPNISNLLEFNDAIYIGAYDEATDIGAVYRHDSSEATLLKAFTSGLSNISGMCEFDSSMYIGLQNGNLWEFNGFAFSNIQTFDEPIKTMYGDNKYLYIGFYNSSHIVVYDGSSFTTLDIE